MAGIVPVSSSAWIFSSSVRADARQLGDLALARSWPATDARRLADRLGGVAVGEHAVHDGAVELVEVGRARRRARRWWRWADRAWALAHKVRGPLMTGRAWLVLPTFNEAENLEAVVAAARRVLAPRRPRASACSSSTTTRPTAPARWPIALAAAHPAEVEVLHRPLREGLGPAYLAGFARALSAAPATSLEMDADLSHDPADLRAPARARCATGRRPGARLALRGRRRRRRTGGAAAARGQPRRVAGTRAARSALDVRDLTGGFKCFRADVLRAIDLPDACARAATRSRSS